MKALTSSLLVPSSLAALLLGCVGHIDVDAGDDTPSGVTPVADGAPARNGGSATGGAPPPGAPVASTPIASTPIETTRFARLSHTQYENSVRDLLRVTAPLGLADALVTEPVRGTFDNNGGFLQVSPNLWLDYQRIAESVSVATVKDPSRLAAIVPPNLPAEPVARARAFVEAFGRRAYRRPLTTAEVDELVGFFRKGPELVASGDPWKDGVQLTIFLVLQSPHFLYRTELSPGPAVAGRVRLDDHEIAAKLSYAVTNTMPDDRLFAMAAAKKLSTRDGLLAEATRLLGTPAAQKMVDDFHEQLLHMSRYDGISKDRTRFPEFRAGIGADMRTETLTFVRDVVLAKGQGLSELLTASYTFANSRIAPIYGLTSPAPPGSDKPDPFVRVELDPTKRAGLLTQAGFLAAFADGVNPQTILRGAFVNQELLCRALPPPPDAFTLPPAAGGTNRQRIEAATHVDGCAPCHLTLINPPGFALEGYDALGRVRAMDGSQPVNTRASYAFDGVERSFEGGVELAKLVAGSKMAHDCYARHWLEYLHGRLVEESSDGALVASLGARSLHGRAPVKALILEMVATDAFVTRLP